MSNKQKKLLNNILKLAGIGFIIGIIFLSAVIWYFAKDLPDFDSISDYKPKLITKVYSQDSQLVAEYAKEKRIYIKLEDVPEKIVKSLLATEDQKFYTHNGFDLKGITRAFIKNVFFGSREGASTITQQLVKNLLLTNERTYSRKVKEIILSYKIERSFTKDEILELYLNHIYLGAGSYGIMQASLTYFNKDLPELENHEIALIMGLPKAPNGYNPLRRPKKSRFRRDVVLGRMYEKGIITLDEYKIAVNKELDLNPREKFYGQSAPDFSEHVRRVIDEKYGTKSLYTAGLNINTTLDLDLQKSAQAAVLNGVRAYDRRHGWKGPIAKLVFTENWDKRVKQLYQNKPAYKVMGSAAYVESINGKQTNIILDDGSKGIINFEELKWARRYIEVDEKGPKIKQVTDVLSVNDIIIVKKLTKQAEPRKEFVTVIVDEQEQMIEKIIEPTIAYSLEQLPTSQAALVAIDVHTGAVKAMVGGFDKQGNFNRAIQAKRQVGSSFKPFVYAAAIEQGFKTNSIILDAPIILRDSELNKSWKPQNFSTKVYGPATLRRGIEKSRNLMTIRLARKVGISNIIRFASKLGLPSNNMERNLSTALGSASMSLLDMVSAYTVFANSGVYNKPYFIESIQDQQGKVTFKKGYDCKNCNGSEVSENILPAELDYIETDGQQVISDSLAYIATDLLQGVVKRGTGWRARKVGIPVGAKTGTTNDANDAWYVGFSADLAVGVWSGFDNPQTLGNKETGSGVSGPIWTEFMKAAKASMPNSSFKIPENIVFVKVDAKTGQLPTAETKSTILDVFENGTQPNASGNTGTSNNAYDIQNDELLEGIY